MGACISHHHQKANSEMKKVQQVKFDSTNDNKQHDQNKVVITHSSTPSNNTELTFMDGHVAVKPQLPPSQSPATFSDYGSKEETFFDSQAWLDSDCEDEFMSVNGEFTPSRGSTPVHHSLTQGKPQVIGGATFIDKNEPFVSKPQPLPIPAQKKLSLLDLFKQSIRDKCESNEVIAEPPNKDGKMGTSEASLKQREAHLDSRQGCFSSLLSVRSTGKQKKKSPPNLAQSPVVVE